MCSGVVPAVLRCVIVSGHTAAILYLSHNRKRDGREVYILRVGALTNRTVSHLVGKQRGGVLTYRYRNHKNRAYKDAVATLSLE